MVWLTEQSGHISSPHPIQLVGLILTKVQVIASTIASCVLSCANDGGLSIAFGGPLKTRDLRDRPRALVLGACPIACATNSSQIITFAVWKYGQL